MNKLAKENDSTSSCANRDLQLFKQSVCFVEAFAWLKLICKWKVELSRRLKVGIMQKKRLGHKQSSFPCFTASTPQHHLFICAEWTQAEMNRSCVTASQALRQSGHLTLQLQSCKLAGFFFFFYLALASVGRPMSFPRLPEFVRVLLTSSNGAWMDRIIGEARLQREHRLKWSLLECCLERRGCVRWKGCGSSLLRDPPLRHTTAATSQAGYPLSPRVSCSSPRRARLLRLPPTSLLHRRSCVCCAERGNLARAAVFIRDAPLLWRSAWRGILLELTGFPRSGET